MPRRMLRENLQPPALLVDLRALAGCLPCYEWPTLACHLGVTLDRGEAHSESTSCLPLFCTTVENFYYLSAQVFRVGFHGPIMQGRSTSSQDAVTPQNRPGVPPANFSIIHCGHSCPV